MNRIHYRCLTCGLLYSTREAAEQCCEHVREIHYCSDCGAECYSQEQAEKHCE